jgi:hypothetical protein
MLDCARNLACFFTWTHRVSTIFVVELRPLGLVLVVVAVLF